MAGIRFWEDVTVIHSGTTNFCTVRFVWVQSTNRLDTTTDFEKVERVRRSRLADISLLLFPAVALPQVLGSIYRYIPQILRRGQWRIKVRKIWHRSPIIVEIFARSARRLYGPIGGSWCLRSLGHYIKDMDIFVLKSHAMYEIFIHLMWNDALETKNTVLNTRLMVFGRGKLGC